MGQVRDYSQIAIYYFCADDSGLDTICETNLIGLRGSRFTR